MLCNIVGFPCRYSGVTIAKPCSMLKLNFATSLHNIICVLFAKKPSREKFCSPKVYAAL